MGKGFNNYMCKKFFHPASRDNLKRVWMAQQKDDAYKKKQEELRIQYEKEQDLYNNKAMLSKESKDKLSVNFMYEPPPGAKKEREKEDNEPEYKFEWQRKYNAPREDYCKGNDEIQDQPFGILVRNVRCIKCRKWGHINTDKECPLYNQATVSEIAQEASDPVSLLRLMREDGFRMKKTALDAQQHMEIPRKAGMIPDDANTITSADMQFLKALSKKEKIKLLKKLDKLEKRQEKSKESSSSESESSSESDSVKERVKKKKKKRKKEEKKKYKKDCLPSDHKKQIRRKEIRRFISSRSESSESSTPEVPKRKRRVRESSESPQRRREKKCKKSPERIVLRRHHHHHHHHKRRSPSPSSSSEGILISSSSPYSSSNESDEPVKLRPSTFLKQDHRRSTDDGTPRPTLVIRVPTFEQSPRTVVTALKRK